MAALGGSLSDLLWPAKMKDGIFGDVDRSITSVMLPPYIINIDQLLFIFQRLSSFLLTAGSSKYL